MKQSEKILLAITLCLLVYLVFLNDRENKQIQKELKEIKQTLDYIDTRMDTLEFFRAPEKEK